PTPPPSTAPATVVTAAARAPPPRPSASPATVAARSAPSSTSTPTPPTDASLTSKDPLVRARALLQRGDTGAAIKLVEQELLTTPGRPGLYELLGDARART